MKKMVLLAASVVLLFVSCTSSPEAVSETGQNTQPPETSAGDVSEAEQKEMNEAFEEVYHHFDKVLILDGAESYRVEYGDTLSKIANRYYGEGNGYYFPLIMLASSDTVLDPDLIEPGMILTIPDLDKNLNDVSVHESMKTFFTEIADVYKNKRTPSAATIREELLKIAGSL